VQQLAIDANMVALGIGFAPQLSDDLAVHRDQTRFDHLFGRAPRGNSGSGNNFLQTLRGHV